MRRALIYSRSYREAVLATNPVGYWRLGESAGTVARDEMGANDGTKVGAPTLGVPGLLSGDPNTAVTFGGTNMVEAAQMALPSAYTLLAWVKATSWLADSAILGQHSGTTGILIYVDGIDLRLYVNLNTLTTPVPSTGATHMVAGTYDGALASIYIDGLLVAGPTAKTGPVATPAVSFKIASYYANGAVAFDGTIDEPAYWNRAMTPAEIADLNRIGRGR